MRWTAGVGLALFLTACLVPRSIAAQAALEPSAPTQGEKLSVAAVGLRSLDGDDDLAHELNGWLRAGVSAIEGWKLHASVVSLEQFMLVQGCESPDESCLQKIAETLSVDSLVSGTVRRVESDEGYDFEADLFLFDPETGQIEKTTRVHIERESVRPEELAIIGQQAIAELASAPFDQLGQEQATELRLSRDGPPPVSIDDATTTDNRFPIWPAAVTYAGAAAFFGLTAWSWTTIRNVENDPSFELARGVAGPEVGDVCTAGTNFGVEDLDALCSKANTQETLQWVFLSMGVAATGIGTWLLVKSVRSRKTEDRARLLEVAPIAGKNGGGVSARFEF